MHVKDQFENCVWAALLSGLATSAVLPTSDPKQQTIRLHRVDALSGLGAIAGGPAMAAVDSTQR